MFWRKKQIDISLEEVLKLVQTIEQRINFLEERYKTIEDYVERRRKNNRNSAKKYYKKLKTGYEFSRSKSQPKSELLTKRKPGRPRIAPKKLKPEPLENFDKWKLKQAESNRLWYEQNREKKLAYNKAYNLKKKKGIK